jgi:ribosomal protein S4E
MAGRVLVLEGEHEGKIGVIQNVYHGWMFDQYTVLLDSGETDSFYHDEVKMLDEE